MLSFKDLTDRKTLPLREQFIRGDVLNIGQLVEDHNGKYQILDRGTNYLICANDSGRIVKKFLLEVKSISEIAPIDTLQCFKGYQSNIKDPIAEECFISLIDKYNSGDIVDSIAILKALKAYNEDNVESLKTSLTRLNELDNYLNLKEAMSDNIKSNDKLKVASVIADTLGVESSGSSPEMMVNNALRNARKNSMMLRGESIKIIMRMLELAKSVGIKYDEKIIKVVEESEESLDELSTEKLAAYKRKASLAASEADKKGDFKTGNKRFSGIMKATRKQFDNDLKEGSDMRMLELAKSVGIKYDEKLIKLPEVNEEIKGWKNAGSDIARMRKARGDEAKTVHLHRLKKDGSESGMHDARKSFSSQEDAQRHHDNSRKLNPKSDIRHNLYIDGKQVSTLKESKVIVTNETGKKMNGKVQAVHGPVQQIKYRNGKTGYYHQHNVSKLEEEDCQDEPTKRTYSELMSAIKHSAGTGEATVDDSELPARLKNGHTMSPTSETNRKQLIKHLLDH
jgi:hypothetical protein